MLGHVSTGPGQVSTGQVTPCKIRTIFKSGLPNVRTGQIEVRSDKDMSDQDWTMSGHIRS